MSVDILVRESQIMPKRYRGCRAGQRRKAYRKDGPLVSGANTTPLGLGEAPQIACHVDVAASERQPAIESFFRRRPGAAPMTPPGEPKPAGPPIDMAVADTRWLSLFLLYCQLLLIGLLFFCSVMCDVHCLSLTGWMACA